MRTSVLLIGYGNPGRLDDGLGPACAEAVAKLGLDNVTVDADYQLCVEDAEAVARHDVVIFADASVSGPEPFAFQPLRPARELSFSTHSVAPAAVLGLARGMFGSRTRGYALAIRGYAFNRFGERLTEQAGRNLAEAVRFIVNVIREGAYPEDPAAEAGAGGEEEEPAVLLGLTQADLN